MAYERIQAGTAQCWEDLLSNLAKVQLGQRGSLSSQNKFCIHCYLTKICESELPSTNKSDLYFVKMFRVISSFSGTCTVFLNTLFSVLCTQDISHRNVFTFPLETSHLLLSKTLWMFYSVFSLWSGVTGMPLLSSLMTQNRNDTSINYCVCTVGKENYRPL